MSIYSIIKEAYPEIDDNVFINRVIVIQNDSDGKGEYISVWEYEQPLPVGLKTGKSSNDE